MSLRPGPGAAFLGALAGARAPAPVCAQAPLVELLTPVVDMELVRVPDADVLCAAGGVVRFRLAREARVSLGVAGQPARGTVDGAPSAVPVNDLSLGPGAHEVVVAGGRREGLATAERPFTLAARAPGTAGPATASGALRDERVDHAVMQVGRTFLSGVDLLDGHLVHQVKDLDPEGRHLSLELTRTYSSAGRSAAGLAGAGWRLNYESAVTPLPECGLVAVRTADGGTQAFVAAPGDAASYRPQRGYHTTLRRNPDGSFDFVDKAANRHHFAERAAGTAASLRLAWIEEPHGDRIALAYDGDGRLREVSEWHPGLGPVRTLVFRHAERGGRPRIVSARAWGLGLGVDFRHDDAGNLLDATRTDREAGLAIDRYRYSTSSPRDPHRLLASTPSGEGTTRYAYAEAAVAGVADAGEAVTSVSPPGAPSTSFVYDGSRAAQGFFRIDARTGDGAPTRYLLNRDGNPLEIDEPGTPRRTVTKTAFDPLHVVKTVQEQGNGRRLEYAYDASGNLTLELEKAAKSAPPRRTAYAYDPRFNKLVHKEDPEGRRSAWTIDPRTGDLLREELPGGKVSTWSYDRQGCLSEAREEGRLSLYRRPDTFCNATEVLAPDGSVTRRRYDPRGRLLDEAKAPAP